MFNNAKSVLALLAASAGFGLLAACNTTETTAAGPMTEPPADAAPVPAAFDPNAPIADGMARIVVYRTAGITLMANVLRPQVKIDGTAVAPCHQDKPILVDVAPGSHDVSMQTDVVARRSVTLEPGQTAWFTCHLLPFGVVVSAPLIEQVPAEKVPAKIRGL